MLLLTERSLRLEVFFRDQKALLAATPSVWPARGYLSASFGDRPDPFTGQHDFHSGIDISATLGTEVVATADGRVLFCGPNGGYGNNVLIDHGRAVVTRYAHLSAFRVAPGQRVRRGDVIGSVGSTGRSTGPHLHYEVWAQDHARDPIQFILEAYRSWD